MINLMPPETKTQIRYSKLNRLALRYARVLVVVVMVLGGVFGGALYILKQQADTVAADVTGKQAEIAKISHDFLPKAKDASERLNAIKYIQDTQTKFSFLIADITKVLPKGVFIDSIRLTGEDKLPVSIQVSSATYDQILALRNSLVTSPRISDADIVSIGTQAPAGYSGNLVIGFKPGLAK